MLKFLRRIRRKLIADGNLKRYLPYAIGEIILVVIGIFIAIQLNNWNENRKLDNQLNTTLEQLKSNLELDYYRLDSLHTVYSTWYNQSQIIIDSVLGGKVEKVNTLELYDVGNGSMHYLSINRTTYNELANSGKYTNLLNSEIGSKIYEYFEYAETELTKVNLDNNNMVDYFEKEMDLAENSRYFRLLNQRNLEYIDWTWLKNPKSDEYKILENRISYFQLAILANQKVIKNLNSRASVLINELETMLSSKI